MVVFVPQAVHLLLGHLLLAEGAHIVLLEPPLDALCVEVVPLVAWQRGHLIVLVEINQANAALVLTRYYRRIELSLGQVLHKGSGGGSPVWSVSPCSEVVNEDAGHEADYGEEDEADLEEDYVAHNEDYEHANVKERGLLLAVVLLFEENNVPINEPAEYESLAQISNYLKDQEIALEFPENQYVEEVSHAGGADV